jgi:hypothetical protein
MGDFDLGIPDNFDLPHKFNNSNSDSDAEEKKKQDEFFTKFIKGEWGTIIKEDVYTKLTQWFDTYASQSEVVVRFKFLDAVAKRPFAIYCIVHPVVKNHRTPVLQVCRPETELFDQPKKFKYLLAIPNILRKKALFCIPADAIIGLDDE